MTIDEKRKTMKAFCKSTGCKRCPVRVIWDELCMEYKMENAPESLIEKAYVLAFGKVKEGNQMNITADEICKAALALIGKRTQSSAAVPAEATTVESFTYGYILGVCALAKRVTEDEENDQKRNA